MALKASILIERDVLDLGFQRFVGALAVGQVIGHLDDVAYGKVLENRRIFFYQDAQPLGRDVPQLELIKGSQPFRSKLYTIISLSLIPLL